jgi:DNA-binding IclR family transcriptional regulator
MIQKDLTKLPDASVKSAVRVLDIFELLGGWDSHRTHTEIAEALDIPKSSLTPLLKTLTNRGYLFYKSDDKSYSLGPAITGLAKRTNDTNDLVALAPPILEEARNLTGETSALNILRGDKSEVVAVAMSANRLLFNMQVGDTAPLYATSGGKALLAHLPREMQLDYLSRVRLDPVTPHTITSLDTLTRQLSEVVKTGNAFVFEEFTPGIVGVARAVLSESGFPLASINIAMPAVRYSPAVQAVCITALERAATTLATRIRTVRP